MVNFKNGKRNLIVYTEKKDILLRNNPFKYMFYFSFIIIFAYFTYSSVLYVQILSIILIILILMILFFPEFERDLFSYMIVGIIIFSLFFLSIFITLFLAFFYVFLINNFKLFFIPPSNIWEKVIDMLDILIFSTPFISLFAIFVKLNIEKIVDFFKYPFFNYYLISKILFFMTIILILLIFHTFPNFYLPVISYFENIKNMFFPK